MERAAVDREACSTFSKSIFERESRGVGRIRSNVQFGMFESRAREPYKEAKEVEQRISLNLQSIAVEWLTRSAIVKLNALTTPQLVQNVLRELKLKDVKSMRGMKMIITFHSKEDCATALGNSIIINRFKSFKPWNGDVAGESRLVWLKC